MYVSSHARALSWPAYVGRRGTTRLPRVMARGIPFRAMVRSPEAAQKMAPRPGVEVVAGDFNDPATIARTLAGIDRAFLLTSSSEQAEAQQSAFVEAARRAGVRHRRGFAWR
jgi:uncharacterized protein YbjT (DUF2867 family)